MTARHYYREVGGSLVEQTERILRENWQTRENAEEGSVGSCTIVVSDPDMDQDYTGHRMWRIIEDASESDDDVIFQGYTGAQEISRGEDPETFEPLGRAWSIELYDVNTVLSRRILRSGKRPAETDVERVQWLLGTTELSPWLGAGEGDVTTYVDTSNPVNMDKCDYTGQMTNAVWDDCAQQSGKNWFVRTVGDGTHRYLHAFYGDYTWDSPLWLSNDPADWVDAELADGTSLVYPISATDKLRRDPARVFTGGYLEYEKGRIYRRRAATETAFALGNRDMIVPAGNVKTKAQAVTRVNRALLDASTQEERITGSVRLPKGKATMIRPGMRIRYRATHMPGYEDSRLLRVLDAAPQPVAGGELYDIAYTLIGPGDAAPWLCPLDHDISGTTGKTYPPLGAATTDSDGNIWYAHANQAYFSDSYQPTNGPRPSTACSGFGFPAYGSANGDAGGVAVKSTLLFVFAGPGTATIAMTNYDGGYNYSWSQSYDKTIVGTTQEQSGSGVGPATIVVTVGDLPADAQSCWRWIEVQIGNGAGGSKGCFGGLTWVPA